MGKFVIAESVFNKQQCQNDNDNNNKTKKERNIRLIDVLILAATILFQFISPTISIAVLTVISIDRYLSLARPILSKAPRKRVFRPNWLISFAWLYSTVQFLPTFYFSSLVPIDLTNTTQVYYCTPIPNKSFSGKIYLVLLFLASFVVPVSTMSVLYYRVARVVWNRKKELSLISASSPSVQSSKIMEGSRKKVIRMLLIVVAVFLICWTPFVMYSGFLEERLKGFPNPMDAVRLGLYGLGLFNSICNPFIYYFNGNFNPRVLLVKKNAEQGARVHHRCPITTWKSKNFGRCLLRQRVLNCSPPMRIESKAMVGKAEAVLSRLWVLYLCNLVSKLMNQFFLCHPLKVIRRKHICDTEYGGKFWIWWKKDVCTQARPDCTRFTTMCQALTNTHLSHDEQKCKNPSKTIMHHVRLSWTAIQGVLDKRCLYPS